MQLIEMSETIKDPLRMNSKIFGITRDLNVASFDSKTGALLKSYDTPNLILYYFVTEDKVVTLGSRYQELYIVESYDIKTGEICETKDSLKNFFVTNWIKGSDSSGMFYDNDSEILYCVNPEGIFSYDMRSEEVHQPIQNENCTPIKNRLPICGIKVCDNVLFLRIVSDPIYPQEPQIYVYTAEEQK